MNLIKYLFGALIPWTILLVDNNRVLYIVHDNIFKMHISYRRCSWGTRPGLDPQTIISFCQSAILNIKTFYGRFVWVLAKATNTNTMAWSAVDILDCYIFASISQ